MDLAMLSYTFLSESLEQTWVRVRVRVRVSVGVGARVRVRVRVRIRVGVRVVGADRRVGGRRLCAVGLVKGVRV